MISAIARTTAVALVTSVTALALASTSHTAPAPIPTSNSSSRYGDPTPESPQDQYYDNCAVLATATVVGEPTGETQTIHLARELSNVSGSESI